MVFFFLTETRRAQFDLAMYILKNEIKNYDQIRAISLEKSSIFELPKTASDYVNLSFFKNWIVGFTNPTQFIGVIEYAKANPLTYKRVKAEFKSKVSNRKTYYYLKRIIKTQTKMVDNIQRRLNPTRRYGSFSLLMGLKPFPQK